ncbi:MAG: FtsX-like permease family protein [Lachnospiraceae bacterium]|nr:FtsX-like permease family protein [Lachnospiraceae bacterium]
MFWRILKKDLKRKKTMNIILLLFVILCSMLAAASLNNIVAVTGGIKHFMEISDAPDVKISMPVDEDLDKKLIALPEVEKVKVEESFYLTAEHFKLNGEKHKDLISGTALISGKEFGCKYFDAENREITSVPAGGFYCTKNFLQGAPFEKDDILTVTIAEETFSLSFEGIYKTVAQDTNNSSSPYIILNSADWDKMNGSLEDSAFMTEKTIYVKTNDVDAVIKAAGDTEGISVYTKDQFSSYFMYDMLTAYILLAACGLLVAAAFVTLRFAIGFTISEEFREIGVMKAVGIQNSGIRSIYITKYAAISLIGSVIGYVASIPLSSYLLKSVQGSIVFSGNNTMIGITGSAAVIVLILLFSYGCTIGINKMSPIDAVRSGQTGERFGKRSVMHLGRSKLPATGFMALNDVLSAPKQFAIITVVFTLCVLMMTVMSNCAVTLSSDKPIFLFGIPVETDASILDNDISNDAIKQAIGEFMTSNDSWKSLVKETEKMLDENGMPGKATVTISCLYTTVHGDKSVGISYHVTRNTPADKFIYDEGTAPRKPDEVALTAAAMEKLDARIGDRIKVNTGGAEEELIITGTFSTFMMGGMAARLCEDAELNLEKLNNHMGIQIEFDDSPDEAEIGRRIEKLKDVTGAEKIYSNAQMVETFTEMSGTLDMIKKMMMLMTVIVTALIVILMERSFISKEKSEIALMKAVGFQDGSVIGQHTLRFTLAAVVASVLASVIVLPFSKALLTFIFAQIGSVSSTGIAFDAVEIFAVCPAILIGVTVIGTLLTALYTKTIKASDTASIE